MRYNTVMCRRCGLVFTNPRPKVDDFSKFYKNLYPKIYKTVEHNHTYVSARGKAVAAYISAEIGLKNQVGIFDIGAQNFGTINAFSKILGDCPAVVNGCDPMLQRTLVRNDQYRIVELYNSGVEDLPKEVLARHSVFILYDVLEHLLDPKQVLTRLNAVVNDGAYLFVSTSCLDNWLKIPAIINGFEDYFLRLAHTFTFSENTLKLLLYSTGWETIASDTAVEKGDQWILAVKRNPIDMRPVCFNASETQNVLSCIEKYKSRCREMKTR